MRVGIIGGGVVGRATARAFIEHVNEVRVYDVVKERRTHDLWQIVGSDACDLVFLCLPTPQKPGEMACDTSIIEGFFNEMSERYTSLKGVNFVLRSTVPIGTTRKLCEKYHLPNLVHSPEFLTARCAIQDAQMPARNIVGIPRSPSGIKKEKQTCTGELIQLYSKRFPGVPVHVLTSDESEAVKLFQNSFFAVKVAFWNECRALSDKLGMDWERVLEAVLADGRIGHSHTKVPGPDGKRGFGGTCLPKDLANLIQCMKDAGSLTFSHDVAGMVGFGTVDGVCQAAYDRNLLDRPEHSLEMLMAIRAGEHIERQILGTPLSDAETWERLNVDRLQLDKGLSIGEAMPDSEMMREAMREPFGNHS